ncbi:MAG TPA: matrixin family metalloprotease, partial [Blastocatellia bacterium]|nr:matrixin family metalloprotease [Blastocatellia bacterium]
MARAIGKVLLSALPVFAILLITLSARATTVVMLSDKDLVVTSRMIVTGEVVSVISAWDDARTMIWTYVEIRRERLLKGEVTSERLVLRQPGGVVGPEGIAVFGQPEFAPGQKVLLYLNTARDGSLRVAHAFMGMFSIIDDAAGRKSVSRSVREGQVEILPRSDSAEVTDRAPLQDYIGKIEQTLELEAAAIAQIEAERRDQPILAIPSEYELKRRDAGQYMPAFSFLGGGVRWHEADSGQAISFNVNPNLAPVAGGAAAELSRAMSAWPVQSGANIRLQSGGQTSSCGNVADGANTISFGDCLNELDPPSGCSGVLAQTRVAFFSSDTRTVNGVVFKRIAEADIVFNDGLNCFLGNSSNLAEVACHEIGHAIGLGHSSDGSALMAAVAHGRGRDANLSPDDKNGVLAIYPSSGSGGGGGGGSLINDAASVNQFVPFEMNAGQSYSVSVVMRNSGTTTWTPGSYRLGS